VARADKPRLLAELIATQPVARALVFTRTKHGADRVMRQLNREGIRADAIHGNKSQNARQRALDAFKANRTQVLVATDIAARGIDVEGISHVINFDIPHEPEIYVHRIGRTGRAGATGVAMSLCDGEERKLLKDVERLIRQTLAVAKDYLGGAGKRGSEAASHGATKSGKSQDGDRRGRVAGPKGKPKKSGRRFWNGGHYGPAKKKRRQPSMA
jgi:ATP-dependent RNA helicase RhlE